MRGRFIPWTNQLEKQDKDLTKVTESSTRVTRMEYRPNDKLEKIFDSKVLESKRTVTKGFLERQKKGSAAPWFGLGSGADDIRMNSLITAVQRDNIWHPYFEVKIEDDDMGTKFRRNAMEKKEKAVDGEAIENIQSKLNQLEEAQRAEKEKQDLAASGAKPARRTLDMEAFRQRKLAEEEVESQKKVDDPFACKLTNVPGYMTEEEVTEAMVKYGKVVRCRIPIDEQRGRNRGFAIVVFEKKESATRAIEDGDVTVDIANLTIERAIQTMRPRDRDRGDGGREQFQQLKRRGA